jgi:uncharacterized protein (DUF1501 family)
MLSLVDSRSRFSRRELLRAGGLGLGGLTLAQLLANRGLAAASRTPIVRDKSVVFLFMQGGPSQFETFDPKMSAPAGIRSVTGEIPTAVPGLTFGSTFERLAERAQKLTVVRSFTTGDSKHDIKPLVSKDSLNASVGAIYSRVAGATRPETGMPSSAVLYPRAVDPEAKAPSLGFGNHADPGQLGSPYAPFYPGAGALHANMQLTMPRERLDDRRMLLAQLDRINRDVDSGGGLVGLDKFQQQAFSVILRGVADAFDLSKEDPRTVARFDTAPLIQPNEFSTQWNNRPNYISHARSVGKLLLLARRLCEAGCGFVTISTDFVWDNHADKNNAGVAEGMRYCGRPFDHAVAAFLDDLAERGLSDKILLVCCGEIGRTPRVNARGGRDHWGNLAPLLLAGGGLPMGRVVGQSTRDGGEPLSDPVTMKNLLATIMHTVFDVGQLRLDRSLPTDLQRMITEGEPIAELR